MLLVVLLQQPDQGALTEFTFRHNLQPRRLAHCKLGVGRMAAEAVAATTTGEHTACVLDMDDGMWSLLCCCSYTRATGGASHQPIAEPHPAALTPTHHLVVLKQHIKVVGRISLLPGSPGVDEAVAGPTQQQREVSQLWF